jgi:TonB family protein
MSPFLFRAVVGTLPAIFATTAPSIAEQERTPGSACTSQAVPAAISTPVPPDYPVVAAEQKISGDALVQVDLAPSGAVLNATIFKTTGNASLDSAAVLAARRQTYSPQIINCQTVGGSYLIGVGFQP